MKRTSLLFALLWAVVSLWADTYTIVFNSSTSDSSSKVKSLDQVVRSATDNCVIALDTAVNIYRAKDGYGIKGGTSSATGELRLKLDATYHITSITLYAAAFDNKEDIKTTKGMTVMGQSFYWNTNPTVLQAYTITLDTLTNVLHLKGLAAKNRFYVQRLEFTAEDPLPAFAKLTLQYEGHKFPSMEYDSLSAAEDAEVFQVSARSVNAEGLSLRMAQGSVFTVSPTSLPSTGGEFEISYSCSFLGYTLSDTIIVSGKGSNGQSVSRSFPVQVTIYKPSAPAPVDSTGMVISVAPAIGYYAPIDGLQDSVLKSSLAHIINCGVRYKYGSGNKSSWAGFYYTDRDTLTNEVLDMYSNEQHFFNTEKPTASVAGFDIEHMFPKSWWGGTVNMAYKDLYHLVPGNASANRSKSNHAPGTPSDSSFYNGSFVTGADSLHGLERVFCPADEYKGDFARAYFYIACCYGDTLRWVETIGSEPASAMTNEGYEEFRPWLRDLLLQWHRNDPVSEKELRRAVEVNKIQGNRNPFIDYPELVEYIWGNRKGLAVDLSALTPSYPAAPTLLLTPDIENGVAKARLEYHSGLLFIRHNGVLYDLRGQMIKK